MKYLPLSIRTSPKAILDHYEGDADELSAPEWVQSEKIQYTFDQPHTTFATFFARLACHDFNNSQVIPICFHLIGGLTKFICQQQGLYHCMVEWAHAIIVSPPLVVNCICSNKLI